MSIDNQTEHVFDWIEDHRGEMVDFLLEFANISSPGGQEKEASDHLYQWFEDNGIEARQQTVVEDRPNAIGILRGDGNGDGDGSDLLFNAHLDTGFGNREWDEWITAEHHRVYSEAWREGDYLFGDDVANDKGSLSAFAWAGLALQENGIDLDGDVYLTGVVGEITGANVDEYVGTEYLGGGLGARGLVNGGITADYGIVAETTNFAISRMACGEVNFKLTFTDDIEYWPRIELPEPDEVEENFAGALHDAARAVTVIHEWAAEYARENTVEYDHGTNRPNAGIGAIRSGNPWSVVHAPGKAAIYVDVYLPPETGPGQARTGIEAALADAGLDPTVEQYLYRQGHIADGDAVEPLVGSLADVHEELIGGQPPRPDTSVTSMWRDLNVLNEAGIPTVCCGPPRSTEEYSGMKHRCMHVDDLVDAAKFYAATALDVCTNT